MVFEKTAWDTIKTSWDIDDGAVMAKNGIERHEIIRKNARLQRRPVHICQQVQDGYVITTPT
jgi:hypothetical protein